MDDVLFIFRFNVCCFKIELDCLLMMAARWLHNNTEINREEINGKEQPAHKMRYNKTQNLNPVLCYKKVWFVMRLRPSFSWLFVILSTLMFIF